MRRMIARLALLPALILSNPAPALAQSSSDTARREAWLEVHVPRAGETIYETEMLLLSVRGYYAIPINREALNTPDIPGFAWMEMGFDDWRDVQVDGRQLRGFERRVALFPERPGTLTIPAFTHWLSVTEASGGRAERRILSEPVAIKVSPPPQQQGWWLPARDVVIEERWDRLPDQLEFGQSAQRTVTFTALGASPEMLPPTPDLSTAGLHVFPHPEERSRRLTQEGPISTVTWRWTVTLLRPEAVVLSEVSIPWFDTDARTLRTEILPRYRVALAEAADPIRESLLGRWITSHAPILGMLLGFALGVLILFKGRRLETWRSILAKLSASPARSCRRDIRRAAWRGDIAGLRAAAYRMAQLTAEPGSEAVSVSRAVSGLDAHLFAGSAPPPSKEIIRSVGRQLLTPQRSKT
ncbi:MAG: BatD family protein [Rhodobacteraceae bacterium]|nr:BatD family protein [Paracoccaceae bacterium]